MLMSRPTFRGQAMKDVMTCSEVVRCTRLSRRHVMALLRRGQLDGVQIGRVIRITGESVVALLHGKRPEGGLERETP